MNLSNEQRNAINHINGPALVLAVPGAGKTTVLINRTNNLIENHNIDPRRILSITFSKASAIDMESRFNTSFPNYPDSTVKFSTIHAFCYGLIREFSFAKNINYKLIEGNKEKLNKYSLLKQIYLEINKEYITEEKLDSLLNSIGFIKNLMITPEEFIKNNKTDISNFVDVYKNYEYFKKKNCLLDFDDMLTTSLEILSKDKYMLNKYRNKYDYYQLDEGQDTSRIQLAIIKVLAHPNNNLFIVADDDQSIYGFRGAYPKGLLNFTNEYEDGKLYYMEENYRSTKNIVSTCNKFIKTNKSRYNKEIVTNNDFLEPINIVKVKSMEDEYEFLLEDLKNHNLENSCILYRNNLSAIGLMEVFDRNNIDFYMGDSKLRFFNHWILQDIINFMKFSCDNSNMEAYEKIYYKMKGYISKKHINHAKTLDYRTSVFDRIMEYPGLNDYYKRTLRELKLDFKKLSKLKPYNQILYLENDLEYGEYLKENSMKFGYTYETLVNILFYLKLISKTTSDLSEFIDRLRHLQHLSVNSRNNKDTITFSTIHSAKGLEFDNVYMIDLIDGDFPNTSSVEALEKNDIGPLEEERRLFYVGMTRAKHYLTLITIKKIGNQILEPSRFLNELQELI